MRTRPRWTPSLFLALILLSAPCGNARAQSLIYENSPPEGAFTTYRPGTAIYAIDDIDLGRPAVISRYTVDVFSGGARYTVNTRLLSKDPCTGTTKFIGNTDGTFAYLQSGIVNTLATDLTPAVTVPETVYVRLTFSDDNAGWVVGEEVELGSSQDHICVDQLNGSDPGYQDLGSKEASMVVRMYGVPAPVQPISWGLIKARYR